MNALLLIMAALAQGPSQSDLLVTSEWLAANLNDSRLVLFHIGTRPTYDAGHIPGAQFLNPLRDFAAAPAAGGLSLELPSPEVLDSVLEARGVSDQSRIILYYSDGYFTPTSRAFFTLEYAGLAGRVAVLDGGWDAWKAEGRAASTEVPAPRKGSVTLRPRGDMVVDAGWVKQHLDDPKVAVVDTRDTAFYNGAETRQTRVGRIPGAANVPFRTVMTEAGRFKDPAALRGILQSAGVKPGETVVTYCHIGQQATLVWFAARLSGYPAKLYDGSFQDWSARRELPVDAPALVVRDSMLVSAEWVKERLGQPGIVVLHADRNRATYDSGHIAGARFADYSRYTTAREPATNELPALEQLVGLMKELGLSYQSRIIIYGDPIPAARLYFTLDYLGLGGRASVLNGGLAAWRAAGGSTSTEAPVVTATDFSPRPWTFLVVDSALVLSRLGDSTTKLVDARSPDEYTGKKHAEGVRPGHIPGAANVDWTTLVRDGQFRPASELRTLFQQAGVRPEHEVVVYYQSGARASVTWFIAKYLGWRPRLYDGAMEEWGRSAALPVER